MANKCLYDILKITPAATNDEIKLAYRRLAKKYHPDVSTLANSEELFKELLNAYNTLSDTTKRNNYDIINGHKDPVHSFNRHDMSSMFDFENAPFTRTKNRFFRYEIDMEKAYHGGTIKTAIGVIEIPRGMLSETQFTSANGSIVVVSIKPHERFLRSGVDLLIDIELSCFDLIKGCDVVILTISGKEVAIKVPKATQHGQILRVPNHGMPCLDGPFCGDLLVRCNAHIPDLTTDMKENILPFCSNKPLKF